MSDQQPEPHPEPGGRPHEPVGDATTDPQPESRSDAATNDRVAPDLGAIERDLASVEAALTRLDDGTYWTDEVTGEPIPDDVLADDPIARRA